jgi:hypothetical protein
LTAGNLTADLHRREAKLDDRILDLTPTEFDTLAYFIRNAERVVSCRDLVKAVHGYDTTENAARPIMRVHIHRLRHKDRAGRRRARTASNHPVSRVHADQSSPSSIIHSQRETGFSVGIRFLLPGKRFAIHLQRNRKSI